MMSWVYSSSAVVYTVHCTHHIWNAAHFNIQDVKLHPYVLLILRVHLDSVDMTEVGQQGHQIGFGVDHVTDAVSGADQQRHLRVFLSLLYIHKASYTCVWKHTYERWSTAP